MVSLGALWLPILLSAVFVFIVSAIIHMVLKYHNSDVPAAAERGRRAGRHTGGNPAPGMYVMPYCSGHEGDGEARGQAEVHRGTGGRRSSSALRAP